MKRYLLFIGLFLLLPLVSTAQDLEFTVNGVNFTMKYVEGGTFQMGGTPEQGAEVEYMELPVHDVTVSSFYIGETEVTNALWRAVMNTNPSKWKDADLPVENVSWDDCQEFISKLNQKTGRNFRLPTEAEWEYAARGGKMSHGYKFSGSNAYWDVAWCDSGNSCFYSNVCYFRSVKSKAPNELGLYDMSGNVSEWCYDWYDSYTNMQTSINPQGPSSSNVRVIRGGSAENAWPSGRVSHRSFAGPELRMSKVGFRLCE